MLRVVEVISDSNIGGAGRLLINRIKNTDRQKFDITVILPQGSLLLNELKKENINICEINGGKNKSFDVKSFFEIFKTIKKISPDIINCHSSLCARVAAKILRVRVKLFTRHCDFPMSGLYKIKIFRILIGFFNNFLSDGAIAVSSSAKNNLMELGIKEEKIRVIINGAQPLYVLSREEKISLKEKVNISVDDVVIGIFARLEKYKDHITFIKAANLLKEKKCVFIIVGEGREENALKEYVEKLRLVDKVLFIGFANDVAPWMNITDININCSVGTETSSLALSEGMSLGIPALVSDYPGNMYMIKHGENGMIFPQRDYVTLAKQIELLMENKCFYNDLSCNALNRFKTELNAKSMTKITEAYYREMYNKKICKNTDL